jgi:hypothetical protein
VLVLLASALISGCGVESAPFIAGPRNGDVDYIEDPAQITFLHNDNENDTDEFEGYELYYKIYEDSDSGCQSGEDCRNDRDYVLNELVQTGPARLLGRAFRRMVQGNSPGEVPNIPVSAGQKNKEFEVLIDLFAEDGGPQRTAEATWPDGPAELNRNVTRAGNPSQYKNFLDRGEYADDDDDLTAVSGSIQTVISNGNLYMSVYALGYGIDPASLQPLYSEPVFLGYVRLDPKTF